MGSDGTKREVETYTDEQVTAACGLHLDNLRRLITWGAVTPAQAGGGRGRVRRWTARQGLRISITAQFVEVGFSLQMAHTLTYCLPLDDLLYIYDPEFIRTRLSQKSDPGSKRFRAMISPRGRNYWPSSDYLGSQVIIVDRRFLYADVLGDSPTLMVIIDHAAQRIIPQFSPYRFIFGGGVVEDFKLPKEVDAKRIERSSLLIDDDFLVDDGSSGVERFDQYIPEGVDTQIISLNRLVCRNFCSVNLALGLTTFIRALLGLPLEYHPFEETYNDE